MKPKSLFATTIFTAVQQLSSHFLTIPTRVKISGPYTPGFIKVEYNNLEQLELALKGENIAGFLVEPIQGEAGVMVPDDDYLKKASELCKKYNALFIADEIQTGIARTGSLLAVCGNCSCEKPL
jgi:ornithine--oxo-acid transaminase